MKFGFVTAGALASLFAISSAQATVVNISAQWGVNPVVFADPYPGVTAVGTTLHLDAGQYFATPVDQSFQGALYTAASHGGGNAYEWGYYMSIDGGAGVKYGYGEGPAMPGWQYWGTQAEAFAAAPAPMSFTLSKNSDVTFYWRDDSFGDNIGGISLNVAAVPEPETYAMLLAGLAAVTIVRSRRRKTGKQGIGG